MKHSIPETPLNSAALFLCCLAYLLLPCLAAWLLFGQALPFFLKGSQFLVFYFVHMLVGYSTLQVLKQRSLPVQMLCNWLLALTWLLAVTRITQGAIHHKPVGFLVSLLLLHSLLLVIIGSSRRTT
ncbi:hypothetical protein [Taibaiella helva]|uniref:hypothetical protein n=1 Tax=Taibaiella helva TaxID=2301235 RepID=UPI000E598F1B|nr:hypothetical protein [Taibaiella helva]